MSCPDLDLVLDAGFDVPADVRDHLATCPACTAELQAAAAFAAGFAEMRAETAPAAVVAAALAAARQTTEPKRRAPDRAARTGRGARQRRWLVAATVLGAVLLGAGLLLRPNSDVVGPVVAERVDPAPSVSEPERPEPTPDGAVDEPLAPTTPSQTSDPVPTPGPRPTAEPEPRAPTSADPPAPPARLADPVLPDLAPREALASAVVPDSVAAAVDGALLAFHVVADAQRVAGRTLTHEAERLGTTLSDAIGTPNLP